MDRLKLSIQSSSYETRKRALSKVNHQNSNPTSEMDVIEKFQNTIDEFIKALDSLSEEELNQSPSSDSWTGGQVGDHILKSLNSWSLIKAQTAPSPRPIDENCELLSKLFLDTSVKMVSEPTDFNYPTNGHIVKKSLVSEIKKVTKNIINFSTKNDLALICLAWEFPTFGHLSRFEWIHFHTVLTQRHCIQLKNIFKQLNAI